VGARAEMGRVGWRGGRGARRAGERREGWAGLAPTEGGFSFFFFYFYFFYLLFLLNKYLVIYSYVSKNTLCEVLLTIMVYAYDEMSYEVESRE
jgi:hypothetical protein